MPWKKGERIPTNLIVGFLGSGKTTAIINLIQRRLQGEHWSPPAAQLDGLQVLSTPDEIDTNPTQEYQSSHPADPIDSPAKALTTEHVDGYSS